MRFKNLNKFILIGLLGIISALFITFWMGCESDIPNEPEISYSAAPPDDVLAKVMAVQEKHSKRFMGMPDVVGIATGFDDKDRPSVIIFTKKQGVAGIPDSIDSVPVTVVVSGEIKALGKPGGKPDGVPVDPTKRFPRPVPIGVSTGHPAITAGTIGCRVKDADDVNVVYALSNNHVYANENRAKIDVDNVLQPGSYDGGKDPADRIGTLSKFIFIKFDGTDNTVDAAIAESSTSLLGNSTPSNGYGTPKSATALAFIKMNVKKYGRTTGLTTGKVYAINAAVNVQYDTGIAKFVDQIIITPGSFSKGGDSGSLIVGAQDPNKNNPVGLLFAGSPSYTIANPINSVLSALNVIVDGE